MISSVTRAVWPASSFTSEATTAKPRPASPARAASMVAFRARRLVWLAMLAISPTISPILADVWFRACTSWVVSPASWAAVRVSAADPVTWRPISWTEVPSSSAAAATVWTLAAASSAAAATVAACIAAMLAVSVMPWAAVCSSTAELDTAPTMPTMACSKLSASSARARLRSAEAAASARRRISACSAASAATMRLIPSTARPTAPISSPRAASAISLSISPCPMRSRVRTRRLRGAVTPRTTTATPAPMAATSPLDAAATSVRVARACGLLGRVALLLQFGRQHVDPRLGQLPELRTERIAVAQQDVAAEFRCCPPPRWR